MKYKYQSRIKRLSRKNSLKSTFPILMLFLAIIFSEPSFPISKIDSLEIRLLNIEPNEKVNTLLELSNAYINVSEEKALEYAGEALKFSSENNDPKGMIKATRKLYDINLSSGYISEALKNSESLIHLSEESGDTFLLCENLDLKADLFEIQGNYKEALTVYNESYEIRKKQNNNNGIADSYVKLAKLFMKLGGRETALNYLNTAITNYENDQNESGKAYALLLTGNIYYQNKDYKNSLERSQNALKLFSEMGDEQNSAVCNTLLGKCLISSSDSKNAKEHLAKALEYYTKKNDLSGLAIVSNQMGKLSLKSGKYNEAAEYFDNAHRYYDEKGDKRGLASTEKNMGLLLKEKEEFVNARQHLLKSLEIIEGHDMYKMRRDIYEILTTIYMQEGNYSKALKYQNQFVSATDSLMNMNNKNSLILMELNNELANIENQRLLESKNNEINSIENKDKQKIIMSYASIALVIILVIVTIIIFFNYRKTNRKLKEIKERSEEFEQKFEANTKVLQERVNEKIAAQQSRDMLEKVLSMIEESVIITDTERRIIYVNRHFESVTAYTFAEINGHIPDYLNKGQLAEEILKTVYDGETWSGKLLTKKKDGSSIHEITKVFPVKNSDEKLKYIATIKSDISESLLTNEVIIKTEAILNALLVNSQNSILLIDPDFDVLMFNNNAVNTSTKIFGEILKENESILKFVPQKDHKSFKEKFAKTMAGESTNCQRMIKGINDQDHLLRLKFNPVETEDKKVIAVLMSIAG